MANYLSGSNVVGKLVITYENTENEKFTETPFYIHGNLLRTESTDNNTRIARQDMNNRVYAAMAQMDELANNSNISAKVVYDFDLTIPASS